MNRRSTSMVAVVAATALVVAPAAAAGATSVPTLFSGPAVSTAALTNATPVAGVPASALFSPSTLLSAVQPAAAPFEIPGVSSIASILSLPQRNLNAIMSTAQVTIGYKMNEDRTHFVDAAGKDIIAAGENGELTPEQKGQRVAVTTNLLDAMQGALNKFALKGDFGTFAELAQGYLAEAAAQLQGLPTALINLNLGALLPAAGEQEGAQTAALLRTTADAEAEDPFALPDLSALLNVAGIPLNNLEQVRTSLFVFTGNFAKNAAGDYLDSDGNPIDLSGLEPGTEEYQEKLNYRVPLEDTNILAAIQGAINAGLQGNVGGAATAIQGYVTNLADNMIHLPGDILTYDFAALNAAFPIIPDEIGAGIGDLFPTTQVPAPQPTPVSEETGSQETEPQGSESASPSAKVPATTKAQPALGLAPVVVPPTVSEPAAEPTTETTLAVEPEAQTSPPAGWISSGLDEVFGAPGQDQAAELVDPPELTGGGNDGEQEVSPAPEPSEPSSGGDAANAA